MCHWVDDMLALVLQEDFCGKIGKRVSEHFQITSYGGLSCFLNVKIERTKNNLMLIQETYIEKMLGKFNLSKSKTLHTPSGVSPKLSQLDSLEIGRRDDRERNHVISVV